MRSVNSVIFVVVFVASILPIQANESDPMDQKSNDSLQLIRVFVAEKEKNDALVVCYARDEANSPWRQEIAPMPAKIGRDGLGDPDALAERFVKLPFGEWDLGFVFGTASEPPKGVTIPYRQVTDVDYWIDESFSPLYNHWVSGPEPSDSHEKLAAYPIRYELSLVMLCNVHPTLPEKGSAIFLHVWLNPDHPTGGCVALDRENVIKILRWLKSNKRPRIRTELGSPE